MSETATSEEAAWYRALFRRGSDAVLVLDGEGRILEANGRAERLLEGRGADLIGRTFREFQGATDESPLQRASTGGLRYDTEILTLGGRTVPVEISLAILPWNGEGRLFCSLRSIVERLRAEAEIRELNRTLEERVARRTAEVRLQAEELERTVGELERFSHAAGHDLRAPVRAISNLAEWIAEDLGDEAPPSVRDHLGLLQERARRLSGLLEGLLAYARIGRDPDPPEAVHPAALVEEVRFLLDLPARIRLSAEGPDEAFVLPRLAVQQVLVNLVDNAIRHHDRDDVEIRIAWAPRGSGLAVDVEDDGPGIPERFRESVFEMFRQLRPSDESGGSGVGLTLVKKALESCGGSVAIEDRSGGGCRIRTVWPLASTD